MELLTHFSIHVRNRLLAMTTMGFLVLLIGIFYINSQHIKTLFFQASVLCDKKETLTSAILEGISLVDNISKNNTQSSIEQNTKKIISELDRFKVLDPNAFGEFEKEYVAFVNNTKNIENWKNLETKIVSTQNKVSSQTKEHKKTFESFLNNTIFYIIGIILVIIAIVGGLGYIISISVIHSLQKLNNGMNNFFDYLHNKISQAQTIDIRSNDEIGDMARSINQNINIISQNIDNDRQLIADTTEVAKKTSMGYFNTRIEHTTQNKSLQELKNIINNMLSTLENNINQMVVVLKQYTNNNYKNTIPTIQVQGSIKEMFESINALGQALTTSSTNDMKNGLTLEKSSKLLQSNVNELTTLAQNQDNSISATVALLEYIINQINENTNKAMQMSALANGVKQSTTTGNELAQNTTLAMVEIDTSTKAISEAIHIINQIAFQTNILSLNAAVEAATAGEAGKGFAVVAQEVRNLASRSAEASRSISALVTKAQEKANEGKEIVDKMAQGYNDLNTNISKTIDIITEVTNGTNQQLNKIDEINKSVEQLAKINKQNLKIANETNQISLETANISMKLVIDAKNKEFENKEKITI